MKREFEAMKAQRQGWFEDNFTDCNSEESFIKKILRPRQS
jgi:hypothetical protein